MQMFSSSPTRSSHIFLRSRFKRGFTLAEIVVVIAIVGLVSVVVVARYRDFDSTAILKNLAYEVALSVREAQILTVSTSNIGGTSQNSYGVSFTADSSTYVLFSDMGTPSDNKYNAPGELVKLITMTQGAKISALAEKRSDGVIYQLTTGAPYADIAFDRPHLDTSFVTSSGANSVIEVIVTVSSPRGATRTVRVLKSGRIEAD